MDLFTPATNSTGILDSMGVAHLLGEPGTAVELAGLSPARPLLRDDRLLLFGYTDYPGADHEVLVRRDLAGLPAEQIRGRPEQAAEEALERVHTSATGSCSTSTSTWSTSSTCRSRMSRCTARA